MSVTKANLFDVNNYSKDVVFVLDTNVLYFVHCGFYSSNAKKAHAYSNVIQKIAKNGNEIRVSSLSVQELLHIIEKKEFEIYCQNNSTPPNFNIKKYRQDATQRKIVMKKLKVVLSELSLFYKFDDSVIAMSTLDNHVYNFEHHRMDPVDYVLTSLYPSANTVFVSDDKDFQSVPSIQVVTL